MQGCGDSQLGGSQVMTTLRADARAIDVLGVQLLHVEDLLAAHGRLLETATARGALSLEELTEHEDRLARVRGVAAAHRFWIDRQGAM